MTKRDVPGQSYDRKTTLNDKLNDLLVVGPEAATLGLGFDYPYLLLMY